MIETIEVTRFQDALGRWRDGCRFYFKLDLAIIAAIAAVVSYFKVSGAQLLLTTHRYESFVNWVTALLVYALVFELLITNTANRENLSSLVQNAKWFGWVHRGFALAYSVQSLLHVFLLIGISAYLLGYSAGIASSAAHGP
jgi:hypothetical protein